MQLNYKRQGQGKPVVLIHGLFGNLDNLGLLARPLSEQFDVISIDVRNHGASFHADEMSYPVMAADLLSLLDTLALPCVTLIGHSMGGKIAMQLAKQVPERVERLVVVDIAPVAYPHARHRNVFAGLQAVQAATPQSRSEADRILAEHVREPGVRQFLLKSFAKGEHGWGWRFNVPALIANYANIMGWPDPDSRYEGPTLMIKGSESDYIQPEYQETVQAQFPAVRARVVAPAGHWLHAEKPALFNRLVTEFMAGGG